ncbi:MAG TPA: response regulator [Candidatus Acidoferrum sp.]|nr:response regulator [Candidatus Acidoferrum sp.]
MQPLALVLYEKLLPGTQLVNRLQDLGWRVQTLHDEAALTRTAEELKPMLVIADLLSTRKNIPEEIADLRRHPPTQHIPVIAFTADSEQKNFDAALAAGATVVVSDTAILQHLNQVLEQALTQF